jgi:ABC-type multidrug transport system fused ATPase/permease subunit
MFEKLNILFTKKQLSKLYLILFASILATFFELVGIGSIPVFAILIIDVESLINNISPYISIDLINKIDRKTLQIAGAISLVSFFVFKNLYLLLLLFFQGKLLQELRSFTSNKLYHHYIYMPYIIHLNRNPSLLIRSITVDIGLAFVYIQSFILLIRESLILVALFTFLLVVDPLITLFSLLFLGGPVLLFYTFYKKKLKSKGKNLQIVLGEEIKTVNQSLGAIKETKLFNKEYHFLSYFKKLIQNKESLQLFSYLISTSPRLFLEVVALFSVAMISAILILFGKAPNAILPLISLFAISAVRFIPALNVITASLTTMRFRYPSFDLVVKEIKDLESRTVLFKKDTSKQNEAKNFKLNDAIIMKDISFDYEEGGRTTLKNINLQIKKGKSVGIIGKSGSGKSTLVDIMLGLLEPQKGGVYFDNNNIKNELSLWQKQIGYIPQDIYLLDDTIKKNITFGLKDDEIDEKLLLKTLKIAQLKDFVDSLPAAINTFVGNRGVKLSGGERQRIGIARAMYNLPKIMVFDEATSSLDIENENKILDEIYENRDDKTLIIISHRNNTVKYCDLIYVLEDGKLIDQGSFKEIFNKYGYLKEMNIK